MTYLVVSCADKAPIIDALWQARKQGGDLVTGLLLHSLHADSPDEKVYALKDALVLLKCVVDDYALSCDFATARDWQQAAEAIGIPRAALIAALTELANIRMISFDTLKEAKELPP